MKQNQRKEVKPMFQAAKKDTTLELLIYDQIGGDYWSDGVNAKDVAAALQQDEDYQRIVLRINSPGGSVFEGSAIFNLLKSQGKPISVIIDGLAASAAFTIAMVGDDIQMGENAMMMLHNGWSMAIGDGNEMRKMADLLDKINLVMAGTYSRRSGQSMEDIKTMMDAETWLTPEDAVAKGFANGIATTSKEDAEDASALATQMLATSKGLHYGKIPEKFKAEKVVADPPKPAPKQEDSDAMCACTCDSCSMGDCADCTDPDCDFDACVHSTPDSDEEMALAADAFKQRERRVRLAELAAL